MKRDGRKNYREAVSYICNISGNSRSDQFVVISYSEN
jgi:hypothetical protein